MQYTVCAHYIGYNNGILQSKVFFLMPLKYPIHFNFSSYSMAWHSIVN